MSTVTDFPVVLRLAEAAELAQVSMETLRRWRQQPGFPKRGTGRGCRIPRDAFLVWLENQEQS